MSRYLAQGDPPDCLVQKGHQLEPIAPPQEPVVLSHRIRLAMDQQARKLGEDGGIVEDVKTYIGIKPDANKGRSGFRRKIPTPASVLGSV
jgi:hypothetical protein